LKNRKKQPYARHAHKNNTAIGLLPRIVSKRMGESLESIENREQWNDCTMSHPTTRAGLISSNLTSNAARAKNYSEVKMGCGKNINSLKPEYETSMRASLNKTTIETCK